MKSIEDFRIELIKKLMIVGQRSSTPKIYEKFGSISELADPLILSILKKASIEQNITPGQERVRLETEIYNLNVAYGFGDYI